MKTDETQALAVIGIGAAAVILALVVQSDGFNSAEKTVGSSVGSTIEAGAIVGLLVLAVGGALFLL